MDTSHPHPRSLPQRRKRSQRAVPAAALRSDPPKTFVYLGRLVEAAPLPVLPVAQPATRKAGGAGGDEGLPQSRHTVATDGAGDDPEGEMLIPTHVVAFWLNVSTRTLLRWCQQRRFPPPVAGGAARGRTKYWTLRVVLEQYRLRNESPQVLPPPSSATTSRPSR